MKSELEDMDKGKILKLYGELTIQSADELKTILCESLNAVNSLMIDIESVTEIDLSCLQLLCAAHQASINEGKLLEFSKKWPESFAHIARESGYASQTGCNFHRNKECVFTERI